MKRLFAFLGAVGMAALMSSGARADFQIDIFADAGLTIQLDSIVDNGAGDSNPLVGEITVSGADLATLNGNVGVTGVSFSSLDGTSNATNPGPLASLTVGGRIAGFGSIFILSTANDYSFPGGPNYSMDSTASGTYTNIVSGAVEFTSYFNDSNLLDATEQASPTLIFPGLTGTDSYASAAHNTAVTGTPLYSLTNLTALTVDAADPQTQNLAFNGGTTVRSIPEPGSVALMLIGAMGLVAGGLRRRKTARPEPIRARVIATCARTTRELHPPRPKAPFGRGDFVCMTDPDRQRVSVEDWREDGRQMGDG